MAQVGPMLAFHISALLPLAFLARTCARKDKNKLQKSLPNIHLGLQTPNLDPSSSSSSDFLDVPLPSPALSPPEHKENLTKNMSRPRLDILLPGPGGMGRTLFNIYAPPREHHLLYSKWGSPSPLSSTFYSLCPFRRWCRTIMEAL